MHIPKLLAVVCLAALGASSLHAQRPDTDIQAKAREKLREAMAALDTQQTAAPTNTPPAKPSKPLRPKKTVTPSPAAPPPAAVVVTPSQPAQTAPGNSKPDAEAKAREQLRRAAAELEAQKPQPAVAITPAPVAPAQPKPVAKPIVKVNAEKKPVKPAEVKTVDKTNQWVVEQPAPGPKKQPKVSKTAVVAPAPIAVAPPMAPGPASKEQRLGELLRLYKSDKITPADYHEQRAKILAEP
ncbi:MAG TPA: hypothetical protein VFC07_12150 [Verrucomicrobiae bacterium]|nr:hypothetical protein [Verrucomicrobiae bacterium]